MFENTKCKKCNTTNICPIGTKYQFPKSEFETKFHETRNDDLPQIFKHEGEKVDFTPYLTISVLVFLIFALFLATSIFLTSCREKALFIFKELDVLGITGGNSKTFLGGVVTLYYFVFVLTLTLGFLSHYLFFNS
ncbi:MAG TPA: hypothetical protein PLU50_11650 [Pseudobdellovibrionaceae bacterium]|nr:hypothetical protein [Pseudobdellovibrionaceae bacterium]